jgi:hypothetical protein
LTEARPVLVVLGSRFDPDCNDIVRLLGDDARLMTVDDLSSSGWVHRPGQPSSSRAVVDSSVVEYARIAGLWPLMSVVSPLELGRIVQRDREYVASEMTAFIRAFLADVPGRVLNRGAKANTRLWSDDIWRWQAKRLGFHSSDTGSVDEPGLQSATVIGERVIGPKKLASIASELAAALGLDLITIWFNGLRLVSASPRPPAEPAIVHEIGRFLSARA